MIKAYQIYGTDLEQLNKALLDFTSIVKLGIQGPPGLEFQINEIEAGAPAFKIGYTGIFTFDFGDLSLNENESVRTIQFKFNTKQESLVSNSGMEIIIDIFGDKGEKQQ